ncbi:MAG TPA: hypothetical protein VM390_11590, partial [Acidimicrobiales bacterium]|nr:hypothetical protein [Acidimicrobiales bacterium]
VPLGPPLDLPAPPPSPEPAANGWYVALGVGFALAWTGGVLAAMRWGRSPRGSSRRPGGS